MQGKIKFALAAALLAIFVAAFAGEALAKPDWLSVKIKTWSIERGNSGPVLNVSITHANNSKNREVTQISDKSGKFTLTKNHVYRGKTYTATCVVPLSSDKVNKVELSPGESTSLSYSLPIKSVENGINGYSWSSSEATQFVLSGGWKISSWNYDCSVKSQKEY